jgi:hypothetical protein
MQQIVPFPNGGPSFVPTPVFCVLRYNPVLHFHDIWPPNWMRSRCAGSSLSAGNLSIPRRTRPVFSGTWTGFRAPGSESGSSLENCHRAIRLGFTRERRVFARRHCFLDVSLESKVPVNGFVRIQFHPPLLILPSSSL